ncbi:MAG: TnpV protein [Actinomycetota bacterium]
MDDGPLGQMSPYGARAMAYVRDHCPKRFAQIPDPIGFFTDLGDQLRDRVEGLAPVTGATTSDPQGWLEELGRANMGRLMAEEVAFSELYQDFPPEGTEDEDLEKDWEPLIPDMSDLWSPEVEET